MIILLVLLTFIIAILGSWLYLLQDCTGLNVPGPTPIPILGNGLMFLGPESKFLTVLNDLKDYYGNAFRMHLFHKRYIFLNHPKYIEPLLMSPTTDAITKGRSYNFLKPLLGEGLLTTAGNQWKIQRTFLTPSFHISILQNFLPVFLKNAKILVKTFMRASDGPSVDVFPIILLTALDNVAESIMGVSINAQRDAESEFVKSFETLITIFSRRMRNLFMAEDAIYNLTSERKIQDKALKILHGHTESVINQRRKELNISHTIQTDSQSETGVRSNLRFLDSLLLAESEGKRVSIEKIREEVITFMFTGHDTVASGLCFALYILSKHPEAQEKILEELKNILGDDLARDPTYSELQQMKYLELVIKESLRIHPPVPLIERLVTEDTDVAGIHVKSNTAVVINIFHIHRNPELFQDPLEFKPERFETQNVKNRFSYIPFRAGPKNCIGQKIAMMIMKSTLATVIKHFKLLPAIDELKLTADVILRSHNGVKVQFQAR